VATVKRDIDALKEKSILKRTGSRKSGYWQINFKKPMKKVLILAYDFPPYVSVGGLRPYSWCKCFHEFRIYPIVVIPISK
jgi:hypothetical protein